MVEQHGCASECWHDTLQQILDVHHIHIRILGYLSEHEDNRKIELAVPGREALYNL